MTDSSTAAVRDKGPLLLLSPRFAGWLAAADVCLALTTYQAGRLFFIGRKADGGVRAHERIIEQCQGLWTDGQTLWTSGALHAVALRECARAPARPRRRARDRKFVPREGRVTGRIDIHDIGIGRDRRRARGRSSSTRCSAASRRSATRQASGRCGGRNSSARWRRRTAATSTASPWTARGPPTSPR